MQKIIWPWETRRWPAIKQKLSEKIANIVSMDSLMASLRCGKSKPQHLIGLFNSYYSDEQYVQDRIDLNHFLNKILPMIQTLILNGPNTFKNFTPHLLEVGSQNNICLSRSQAAVIMACIWFDLFDYNYISKGGTKLDDLPTPTFENIYNNDNVFALQCLLNYFNRVNYYLDKANNNRMEFINGRIIIKRNVILDEPDWIDSSAPLSEIYIGEGYMDDSPAKIHVAYAHEYIGGPQIFNKSLSQEEILLLVRPECMIATLFCAKMNENESITVFGAEKMSQYIGYGSSVKFAGNHIDLCTKGCNSRETMSQIAVIFMDAGKKTDSIDQCINDFGRDLKKAYCGYLSVNMRPGTQIASGNWTYGFNGNNMQLKFLQQLMAASLTNKCLVYYPTGKDFEDQLIPFIQCLENGSVTVGELFEYYLETIKSVYDTHSFPHDMDFFTIIMEKIK